MDWRTLIGSARKARQDIAAELEQKKADLETLEREKARLVNAPAAKADLKAFADGYVRSAAAECRARFVDNLRPFANRPAEIGRLRPANSLALLSDGSNDGAPTGALVEQLIAFACEKDLAAAMSQAIDGMDLAEGPPQAERRIAIERIDGQITRLHVEIDEMTQAAQASGLFIE